MAWRSPKPYYRHVRTGNHNAFLFSMVTSFIKAQKEETNSKTEVGIFIIYKKIICQLQTGACQGHSPSASVETEQCAAAAVAFDIS